MSGEKAGRMAPLNNAYSGRRSYRISADISTDIYIQLREYAAKSGYRQRAIIEAALKQYLEEKSQSTKGTKL